MRFFPIRLRPRNIARQPGPPPPPSSEPLQGELPPYHDHVVRIGVEVEPRDEAHFLATVGGRPWQYRRLDEGEYDVHIAVSGATLGSTGAALAEIHHVLARSGVSARVVFATRLRPRPTPFRRYRVLPRGWSPAREWLAAPIRGLMFWRSKGTLQATSLTEARSRLDDFVARNPQVGRADRLMVVGPPGPSGVTGASADRAEDPMDGLFLPSAIVLLVGAGAVFIGLWATLWRPEGSSTRHAVAFLISLPCLFGVWQMFRRIPEGRINTWLPLGLTALAAPLTIGLSNFSRDVYLQAFGISPGDVPLSGQGRLFAVADTLPLVMFSLLLSLGVFGLLRYFHFTVRGDLRLLQWSMALLAVLLYGLTSVTVLLERDTRRGLDHVAHYRTEGGPARGHTGLTPSVVCVETGTDPVHRIGPPLTTDRPVLYFDGANNVDLLWDREHGLTKVTRFSVSLTPVPDLNADCPEPGSADD
jgi:hypothetical protein